MKQKHHDLLNSSMSRQEFLKLLLMSSVALFGLNTFVRTLNSQSIQVLSGQEDRKSTRGFGASRFGE